MYLNSTLIALKRSCLSVGALAGLVAVLPSTGLSSEYDLSPSGTQTMTMAGAYGGTAIVSDYWSQPAGTGVFKPFLTLDANGQTSTGSNYIEQAYNADGFKDLYLDGLRPNWNTTLRYGDLATITINQINYFAFILDANEPGGAKSTLSIDNIRIYTSSTDNTANVANDLTKLDNLGTLRWAMNDPTKNPNGTFNMTNWIKLDAGQENINMGSNGGSGMADMIIYIPQTAFGHTAASDFVWFYNLNGVHYSVDKNLGATAGFEEWSAVKSNNPNPVPDNAGTCFLLASALSALGVCARRLKASRRSL
ncbi:MAG: hypothetical protein JWM88_1915 [Verrucomicrobia bacterium]|nr:hypothetical protein [Verrucomicrobiota bacterium]